MELLKKIKEYCELIVFLFSCGIFYKLKTWGFDNWEIILCFVPVGLFLVFFYFLRRGYLQFTRTNIILMGSVLMGSITGTSIGAWSWLHGVEPFPKDTIGIYVARFKGDYGTTYRDEILQALVAEIEKAKLGKKVLVKRLPRYISGDKAFIKALSYGEKGNASIVIWGEFPSGKKVRACVTFLGDIPLAVIPTAPIRVTQGEGISLPGNLTEIKVPEELIQKPLVLTNFIISCTYYKKDDYIKAIEKLKSLIEENPNFSEAHCILGMAHFAKEDYKSAVSDFERAVSTTPLSPEPLRYLYYTYMNLAVSYLVTAQHEKSAEIYEKIVNLFPDIPTPHLLLGCVYGPLGRHKIAIEELNKALVLYLQYQRLGPQGGLPATVTDRRGITIIVFKDTVTTLNCLGWEYMGKKLDNDALKYFKRAIEFNPNDKDAQFYIVKILSDKSTIDETIKAWIELLGFEPDYMFYHRLGICFLSSEREDNAIKAFEKAIEMKPSYPFSYFSLGGAYLKQGLLKEAIKTQLALEDLNRELGVELLLFYRRQVLSDEVFAEKLREQIQHLPLEYQNLANKLLKRKEAN